MAYFCGLSWFGNSKYERLSKKQDNYGITEIQAWIKRNPKLSSHPLTLEEITQYAQNVLRDLPVIVTSANCHLVENHLVMLAKQSDFIQTAFFNNISKINCENDSISNSLASKII
ncbi:MAG: hypothetical protein LLG04_04970 [Parachlamydia sp.]|nr:hypothetical protein [Parachlamydia sp.]